MKKWSRLTALVMAFAIVLSTISGAVATEVGYDEYVKMVQDAKEAKGLAGVLSLDEGGEVLVEPSTFVPTTHGPQYIQGDDVTLGSYTADAAPTVDVVLEQYGKINLVAPGAGQWQANVAGHWVDITGETDAAFALTFAKVQSLFDVQGTAHLRCLMGDAVTQTVNVGMSYAVMALPVTAEEQQDTAAATMPMMASANDGIAVAADNTGVAGTFTVVINYQFTDGRQAASPYTATLAAGSALNVTVNSPAVLGYKPDHASITINENITENKTYIITYHPAEVNYTVKHYQQNVDDDHYTLVVTETKIGYTENPVGAGLGKKYDGFYSLLYDEEVKIAADGSTEVEIYYDRYYYLMNFDLDGGYGVEPIYARYGATIEVGEPSKAGYTFAKWQQEGVDAGIPATMPAKNCTYTAIWTLNDTAKVTVVFWGENAEDEGYSHDHTGTLSLKAGTEFTYSDTTRFVICGKENHTHTADCAYACGKPEHQHTDACGYVCTEHIHDADCYKFTCTETEHQHSADCFSECSIETHNHSVDCYENVGESITYLFAPDNAVNGQLYKWPIVITDGVSIYIDGTWYKYDVNRDTVSNGQIISPICGKTEIEHIHGDGCCKYDRANHTHTDIYGSCYSTICVETAHRHDENCERTCGQEAHKHSEACGYSCGLEVHTHTNNCYENGSGMDTSLWTLVKSDTVTVAADGSTVVNVYYDRTERTLTFKYDYSESSYQTTKTITKKWGAKIANEYAAIVEDAGTTFWSYGYNAGEPYTNHFATMPAESDYWTYYHRNAGGSEGTMYYYGEPVNNNGQNLNDNSTYTVKLFEVPNVGGYSVSDEDRYVFDGFTYHHGTGNNASCPGATFYYSRNSYKLEYMSSGSVIDSATQTLQYEAPLAGKDFTPAYPTNLEPNAYSFDGWYYEAALNNEVDWANDIMPSANVIVYAKWVPIEHTVNFYLTQDVVGETALIEPQQVPHGNKVPTVPADVTNGSYTFVGWFYTDENGVEKAFDPENMPVNRDLDLYGKWSANTLVEYTIKYAVENDDGTLTYIAEDTTGKALALTTKTFDAKTGDELFDLTDKDGENYQSGYFPKEASHSITMSADEGAKNEFTFIYVPKEKVPYTVRYLEEGTNAVLHEEKIVETRDAIVTENFVPITGYMPDAYQKRLVLSANDEENVITFWYVKDDTHAPLHIVHYTQNIEGDGYTVYQESTDINALIGNEYSENQLTIPGFEYKADKSTPSGIMTAAGLELKLYYDRIEYPYEFKFLEQGTDKVLADSVTGTARYQAHISQNATPITGYTCVSSRVQAINIAIEDPAGVARNNVRIFYYQENQVTIEYKVVGPDGTIDTAGTVGTATPASETIKVRTDEAGGSTAAPKDNTYKFVGWFKDEACTQPVDAAWVTNTTHITPAKTGDKDENQVAQTYEAATYYAKFDWNLGNLKITKSGLNNGDSAIFTVYINGVEYTKVVLTGGKKETVTLLNLTAMDKYKVVEDSAWTTRYEQTSAENMEGTIPGGSTIEAKVTNKSKPGKWLDDESAAENVFTVPAN